MMVDMEAEIICMFNKGPWVFAGVLKGVKVRVVNFYAYLLLANGNCIWLCCCEFSNLCQMLLQAWNTETGLQISLEGSVSQVNALAFQNELLFAGLEVIFASFHVVLSVQYVQLVILPGLDVLQSHYAVK